MKKRTKWTIGFLGVTALALIMELFAAFDGDPDTQPWTYLIVRNVPAWVTFPVITGIFIWLIFHFRKFYRLRKKGKI